MRRWAPTGRVGFLSSISPDRDKNADDETGRRDLATAFRHINTSQGDTFTVTALLSGSALGMGGNDSFAVGGTGSIDIVDGGTGTDSLSYTGRTAGVTVNMANVNAVESLTGSGFSDTFNFDGVEGNEITIVGGGGANDIVAVIGNTQIGGDLNVSDVDSVSIGADLDAGANDVNLAVDGAIRRRRESLRIPTAAISATIIRPGRVVILRSEPCRLAITARPGAERL